MLAKFLSDAPQRGVLLKSEEMHVMKRFLSLVCVLGLLVSGSAFAAGESRSATTSEPELVAPAEGDVFDGVTSCPGSNTGNQDSFNVYMWSDMFVVQTNSQRTVNVTVSFNDGSAQADVRLHNVSTGANTGTYRFKTSGTKGISVGCGDWVVQVRSASKWGQRAHGSISAYPQ